MDINAQPEIFGGIQSTFHAGDENPHHYPGIIQTSHGEAREPGWNDPKS